MRHVSIAKNLSSSIERMLGKKVAQQKVDTEQDFQIINYNVVRSPSKQFSSSKKKSRTMPKIEECPTLEDETINEIEMQGV